MRIAKLAQASYHVACDLGASSGRVILGCFEADRKLTIEEVHRFPNGALPVAGTLRWNVLGLYREILTGLRLAAAKAPGIASISVDSWGVDYALVGKDPGQPMLAPAWCYRDGRADAGFAELLKDKAACAEIWAETGIQFMAINTLHQLRAERAAGGGWAGGTLFLPVADYLHFLLCGVARAEESLASTTQLYHPTKRAWSAPLQQRFGLPASLFPEIVPSGTRLGPLRPELARECGLPPGQVEVIATCSHDTAAAIAATPGSDSTDHWAYLISGTWSLLGVERKEPLLTTEARAAGLTNEVGVGGTIRLLKNIAGLWLLQEARREWALQGQEFSFPQLVLLARKAPAFGPLIQPNAARFLKPGDLPAKIAAYCEETAQVPPATPGETVRCIFESLALLYRQTLGDLERLTGHKIHVLHVVGGGSQNVLLNQMTAGATGRQVLAGPAEATAIGNLLVQAMTLGQVQNLRGLRHTVAYSFPIRIFTPVSRKRWDQAAGRFAKLELLT